MHQILLYAAFGWLLFGGVMHFSIDVVSQHLRGVRSPGPETSLHYGLHSAYALGQILFGTFGLLGTRSAMDLVGSWPVVALCLTGAGAWIAIGFLFIEYWQPKFIAALFGALILAAALTA